jgi:hypothetical protein
MLGENIQSVIDQTCHDVEQVFIVDHTRQGIHVADRALALNKDRVEGEYVYILDTTSSSLGSETSLGYINLTSSWSNHAVHQGHRHGKP